MSSGDFAAQLRQSVQEHLSLIHNAAQAAKARIGEGIAGVASPPAAPTFANESRPSVNFDLEEPEVAFDAAPRGLVSFDDLTAEGVDDAGIPVWEDAP